MLFLLEILGGLVLPLLLLARRAGRERAGTRTLAAVLVASGVVFNRLNVSILGMMLPGEYVPSPFEFAVAAGAVAAILLCYTLGVKLLPIHEPPGDSQATP
jgi:Ni/Fe-hydrogenase subunit HybB-like protein